MPIWRREVRNGSKTVDLFPIAGCCISRPPDIDRGCGRALRPLNDRHKKSNTNGVGSGPLTGGFDTSLSGTIRAVKLIVKHLALARNTSDHTEALRAQKDKAHNSISLNAQ